VFKSLVLKLFIFVAPLNPWCFQINFDGIEALCADLGVDANDISVFIFAWHCQVHRKKREKKKNLNGDFQATTLGEFSWEEFRRGAEELRIDSISSFKGW
jgi:hypothetical protein